MDQAQRNKTIVPVPEPDPQAQAGKDVTVLLVDDDDDCRMLLREAIADADRASRVIEASDGRSAIEVLRRRVSEGTPPALIFLDIEMPRLDGLETLRLIKNDPQLREIPVVMLTGVADAEHMRRAASYGANSYTIKPADAEHFIRTVMDNAHYWLGVHQYPSRHLPQEQSRR